MPSAAKRPLAAPQHHGQRLGPVHLRRPQSPPPAVDGLPAAWPRTMLPYLQMVTGLIEGRPVSWAEVVAMLLRALRQHRMVRTRRIEQTVDWLHAEPP